MNRETNRATKMSNAVKVTIAVAIIAVAAASTSIYYSYYKPLAGEQSQNSGGQNTLADDANAIRRGPPPVPLIDSHGPAFPFGQAMVATGFKSASLPSQVPNGLNLDSVRVKASGNVETSFITAFYTPDGVKAADSNTFEDVMRGGGIAVIYAHEPTSPTYDQAKWMKEFVADAPDVRRIETVNGHPAIAVTGNPDKGLTYQVYIYEGDLQINLVSLKYTDTDLLKIAGSIA